MTPFTKKIYDLLDQYGDITLQELYDLITEINKNE